MKYLIRASWVVLIACMLVKLFGGNWFEIVCNNKNFIAICNYVDNNMWLKMILACIFQLISGYFILSIIFKTKYLKIKYIIIFMPLLIIRSILSWYIPFSTFIFDLFITVIIPIIITRNWKRVLIVNLLMIAFQLISMFIRNLSIIDFNDNNTIVSLIMQIDYYVMMFIYYLYTIKERRCK